MDHKTYGVRRKLGSSFLIRGVSREQAEQIAWRENLQPYSGILGAWEVVPDAEELAPSQAAKRVDSQPSPKAVEKRATKPVARAGKRTSAKKPKALKSSRKKA
jgi:hypothetical protein